MKFILTDASNNRKVFRVAGAGTFLNPFIKLQSVGAGTDALGDVKITSGSYNTPGETIKLSRGDSDPRPVFGYDVTRTSANTPIPRPITIEESFSADTTLDFIDNNTPFVIKNTSSNAFFVGDSSVTSSNGYKLSPGESIPKSFSNIRVAKVAASSSCTASIITT
jgi:hypothetical protein